MLHLSSVSYPFDSRPPVLGSGADNITLPKDKVLEIIQHLSAPEESKATDPYVRKLGEAKKEPKILKAHVRLGEYAGKVYNELKHLCWNAKVRLRAEILAEELEKEVVEALELQVGLQYELPEGPHSTVLPRIDRPLRQLWLGHPSSRDDAIADRCVLSVL